jgi:hypothetical protein
MVSKYTNVKFQMSVSVCLKIYQFLFRDSVMVFTNRISYNVFRAISYTKKKWLRSNFFLHEYFEAINVINDLQLVAKNGNCQIKIDIFLQFFPSVKPSYER